MEKVYLIIKNNERFPSGEVIGAFKRHSDASVFITRCKEEQYICGSYIKEVEVK